MVTCYEKALELGLPPESKQLVLARLQLERASAQRTGGGGGTSIAAGGARKILEPERPPIPRFPPDMQGVSK